MECPICHLAAMISGTRHEVEGDQSPDTETKVYLVQEFSCRNPQCPSNGKVIGEVKHRLV